MNLKRFIRKLLGRAEYGWSGDYPDWESAKKQSSGYDEDSILEKVKDSLLKVKRGEAAAERDSVLFDKVEYSYPLLAHLMHKAALNKGKLSVLDFGGSLGSSYYQNRKFLDGLESLSWSIVEQDNFIKAGKEYFEDATLHFYETVEACMNELGKPDVILLSCVLPYLPAPYEMMKKLASYGLPYIIIENTPLQDFSERDILCVQKVHPAIYEASYPCWLLNRERVIDLFKGSYDVLDEYENESVIRWEGKRVRYNGVVFGVRRG